MLNPFRLFSRRERPALNAGRGTRHRSQRPPQAEAGFLLGDRVEVKATFTPSRTQLAKTKSKMKGMRKKTRDPARSAMVWVSSSITRHRATLGVRACQRASLRGRSALPPVPSSPLDYFPFFFNPGNAHKTSSRASIEL